MRYVCCKSLDWNQLTGMNMQKMKTNYIVNISDRLSVTVANTCENGGNNVIIDEETLRLLKEEADPVLCTDYEVNKLLEEIQITIKEVEESEYYLNMVQLLQNNRKIRKNMLRVLGGSSDGRLQMVVYGLGSIQFSYKAQYQLSVAILLRRDFSHWIDGIIEIFDPCTSPVDAKVMTMLGCTVLMNEGGCRRVKKRPTLFFVPNADYEHVGSLLEANWCPSRLNKMVLFTSSFKFQAEKMKILRTKLDSDDKRYLIKTILKHTIEVDCRRRVNFKSEWFVNEEFITYRQPFHITNWHFFNLLSDDVHTLEALLPETKLETIRKRRDGKEEDDILNLKYSTYLNCFRFDKRKTSMETNYSECKDWSELLYNNRLPGCPSKRKWCSPSTDWIKLNFSAAAGNYQGSREIVVGYGGIFHNENKDCLISYSCPLLEDQEAEAEAVADDDLDFANAKALKKGLRLFMDLQSSTTTMDKMKLIIEGDSVSIVRWANRAFPPPKRLVQVFKEIHHLMSCITRCLVFHIYKEANSMAIELANEGATTGLSKLHRGS